MRTVDQNEKQPGLGEPIRKESGSPRIEPKWHSIPGKPDHERSDTGEIRMRTDRLFPQTAPYYVAPSLDWWMSQRKP